MKVGTDGTDKEKKQNLKTVKTKRTMSWMRFTVLISAFIIFNLGLFGMKVLPFMIPVMACQDIDTKSVICAFAGFQRALTFRWPVDLYFSFAAFGSILIFAALIGRFSCSWLCPGTLIQDTLSGIRSFFNIKPREFPWKVHVILREVKYALLIIIILFSLSAGFIRMADVSTSNAFREQMAGELSLEPVCNVCISPNLLLSSAGMIHNIQTGHFNNLLGVEYWTLFFVALLLIGAFFIKSFFCKYLCAFGGMMGWFNKVSGLKIVRDNDKCPSDCKICETGCPMRVDSLICKERLERVSDPECHMCLECVSICPEDAVQVRFMDQELSRVALGKTFKRIFKKEKGGVNNGSYTKQV